MPKQTKIYTEQYEVRFITTNKEGFYQEEKRYYWFASRNKHKQAIAECKQELKAEGKEGKDFICTYC